MIVESCKWLRYWGRRVEDEDVGAGAGIDRNTLTVEGEPVTGLDGQVRHREGGDLADSPDPSSAGTVSSPLSKTTVYSSVDIGRPQHVSVEDIAR